MRPDEEPAPEDEVSDGRLWHLISQGDQQAFTELYERHAQAVWNYAYRTTASWTAADDLLATTFLTAWRRRGEVRLIRDSALPWLYTVTGNVVRDERRRLSRYLRLVPRLVSGPSPDHAERLADAGAAADRLRRVLTAIDQLPPAEREAVRMCLLGGTAAADAAEVLGITESSVRSRLSRARARLLELTEETDDA
ncbi:sigma-70 family RNA polymerase sigma factor [Amycolatopsis sp. NPDC005232]|uniref:RNA polymerase sigma factor n=1 Tax=Amycolatopsis sp. NPDC005232 TaxID=3157027 RepID=UPI0033A9C0C3